ncbi:MAG: DUF1361 domain-containing protein, partial [Bacteroidia bacterium]|nr:DUF1361 domain-containing protein [Bacteroidia bacterium]
MLKSLKLKLIESGKLKTSIVLFLLSVYCFALTIARATYTGSDLFLFLNWNLFLAFIPWLITTALIINPNLRNNMFLFLGIMVLWIAFFPNAPYILTDLFHIKWSTAAPIWFDTAMILTFAWTALCFGFLSLMDIDNILTQKLNSFLSKFIITVLLFAAGFGVYIGRYLRWNSWDLVNEPSGIIYDIGERVLFPLAHPGTWGMTLLMGLLLNMMFWTIKFSFQNR